MRRKKIKSDSARIQLLETLTSQEALTGPRGEAIFPESIRTRIRAIHQRFQSDLTTRNAAFSHWRNAVETRNRITANLADQVRCCWSILRNRIRTGTLTRASLPHFGMGPKGRNPKPTTPSAWIVVARALIEGDEKAESRGLPPLTEPNRATIESLIETAMAGITATENAHTALHTTRARLGRTRTETDDLIAEIILLIRLAYRKQPEVAMRHAMRTLGFQFLGDEQTEPEPVT